MIERNQPDPEAACDAALESIFNQAMRDVVKRDNRPYVEARFYPYAGLSSTIRLRKGRAYARVSDILRHSPREVLYALACILVARMYRLKTSREHEQTYREYAARRDVMGASEAVRRQRGFKITTSPRGKVYDLGEIFDELNARYFQGKLARPVISWSQRRTRRVLGHHDHVHDAVIISRTLDSPRVPRLAVEYVLYHEMLHIKHPPRVVGRRTMYHTAEFRRDERCFEGFEEALGLLETLSLPPRRRRRPASPRRGN